MKYLSTNCISNAVKLLKQQELPKDARNLLHIIFICKSLGISNLKSIKKSDVQSAYDYAFELSSLFSKNESSPSGKNDWVNPLFLENGLIASEPLNKWMNGRIINNIFGGGTQWRSIIKEDVNEGGETIFKLRFDYLAEIKKLLGSKRLNLAAIAVWFSRFREFAKEESLGSIISYFKEVTNIDDDEINVFFYETNNIKIEYSDHPFDTAAIRQIIGKPQAENDSWYSGQKARITKGNRELQFTTGEFINMENNTLTIDSIKKVLEEYYQIILSGPPGTSKSFYAEKIAKTYDDCLHIQFHPQYSYQEFMGGYVVDGSNVVYRDGALVEFIEKEVLNNPDRKYLLIIDEINRANTSQVFGECIQCLDRGSTIQLRRGSDSISIFQLPKNLYIIGTLNSTDKSVGNLDLALKRRFIEIYCAPDPNILLDLCPNNDFISLSDFLRKINNSLVEITKNREFVIGHALFLQDFVKNESDGKFYWDYNKINDLFNYKILPMVEEYCSFSSDQITCVLGEDLPKRLRGANFEKALKGFMGIQ